MSLAVLAPSPGIAIAGYGVLGLGVATIVPIAFTLAGTKEGVPPAWGISRVTTLGYAGLFSSPPVIGLVAQVTGLAAALAIPAALLLLVFPLSRVTRGGGSAACARRDDHALGRPRDHHDPAHGRPCTPVPRAAATRGRRVATSASSRRARRARSTAATAAAASAAGAQHRAARRAVGVRRRSRGPGRSARARPPTARIVSPWRPVSEEPFTCSRAPARSSPSIAPSAPPAGGSAPDGRSASRARARAPRRSPRGSRPRRRRTAAPRAAPSGGRGGPWAIASSSRSPSSGRSSCASSAPGAARAAPRARQRGPHRRDARGHLGERAAGQQVADVRRRADDAGAVRHRHAGERDGLGHVVRAVVDARQQVEVRARRAKGCLQPDTRRRAIRRRRG